MKNKNQVFAFILIMFLSSWIKAQNQICFQVKSKDFAVWAYKKHNEISKIICDNIRSGNLASYNAKNLKEAKSESIARIATSEVVAFVQTDPNDPTVGHDTAYKEAKQENYFLFKTSGEYVIVKSDKKSNNVLKLKKSDLLNLLSSQQKEYFINYTTGFALCIDSIPSISKRIFLNYVVKLFDYSKEPSVKLFINDSLNKNWTTEEKITMSQDQYVAFLSTDPDDPTEGRDTIILTDYNIRDTSKEQALLFMLGLEDFKIRIRSVSCGLERKLLEYMPVTMPFGYLPYLVNSPFSSAEMEILNEILALKMADSLNTQKNNEGTYEDYFGLDN